RLSADRVLPSQPHPHIKEQHQDHYHPFLSSCLAAHRELHSFPTRRSSDLHGSGWLGKGLGRRQAFLGCQRLLPLQLPFDDAQRRSEEHTSELQSLAYFVCRLLLEKKKKRGFSESYWIASFIVECAISCART